MDWAALATLVLVVVGGWQIISIRIENKRERTLRVCERYNFDPVLDYATRRLRTARNNGDYSKNPLDFRVDVITVLNYLDGIAIGIGQGLYSEPLARDHLDHIVSLHSSEYLGDTDARSLGFELRDFRHLCDMKDRWGENELYFRSGRFSLWRLP